MRVILGITRGELSREGYRLVQHADDRLELEIEDGEYLHSVWMTGDGQELLNLPLAVVPRSMQE